MDQKDRSWVPGGEGYPAPFLPSPQFPPASVFLWESAPCWFPPFVSPPPPWRASATLFVPVVAIAAVGVDDLVYPAVQHVALVALPRLLPAFGNSLLFSPWGLVDLMPLSLPLPSPPPLLPSTMPTMLVWASQQCRRNPPRSYPPQEALATTLPRPPLQEHYDWAFGVHDVCLMIGCNVGERIYYFTCGKSGAVQRLDVYLISVL